MVVENVYCLEIYPIELISEPISTETTISEFSIHLSDLRDHNRQASKMNNGIVEAIIFTNITIKRD